VKLTHLLPLLGALALPALLPAEPATELARVLVSTETLDYDTRIEAAFPRPMVDESAVGKLAAKAPAKATPAWKGTWTWTSPRVALFSPSAPPKMGATYLFQIRSGMKDLDGQKVGRDEGTHLATPGLELEMTTSPVTGEAGWPVRQKPLLLVFNAAVSLKPLPEKLSFIDADGQTAEAAWRYGRWDRLPLSARRHMPWSVRVQTGATDHEDEDIPTYTPDTEVSWTLEVWPSKPLPAGKDWKLHVAPGITPLEDSRIKTKTPLTARWGTILPGKLESLRTYAPVDGTNSLEIAFDKPLAKNPKLLLAFLEIKPSTPEPPKVEITRNVATLSSPRFGFNTRYKLTLKPGLPMLDGLPIPTGYTKTLSFHPHRPSIGLPSADQAQLVHGRRQYPIDVVNLASLRLQAREIPAKDLPRVLAAYKHYRQGLNGGSTRMLGFPVSDSLVPGKVVLDRNLVFAPQAPVNRSESLNLDWKNILDEERPTTLFLHAVGKPSQRVDGGRLAISQAVVQITDLGLAWKRGDTGVFAFVFSHASGDPVEGARLSLHDEQGAPLTETTTDKDGIAQLKKSSDARWIMARTEKDVHASSLDAGYQAYSPWRLGAPNYDWRTLPKSRRAACIFTDRNLYRPGDTVHLATLLRNYTGHLPTAPGEGEFSLTCEDDSGQVFHESPVTLKNGGLVTADIILPPGRTGYFEAVLHWKPADGSEEESFSHYFLVQDFRRNAFEVNLKVPEKLLTPKSIKADVQAQYFLGAPVATGQVQWSMHLTGKGFYPDGWRDYFFADHRTLDGAYWSHYFGIDYYWSPSHGRAYLSGEAQLDTAGSTSLAMEVPENEGFPMPRQTYISVEVTDPRGQTISAHTTRTIHASSFYLGVERPRELVKTGEEIRLDVATVGPDGKRVLHSGNATLRLEREVWETVEVKRAGGGVTRRNTSRMEPVWERSVALAAGRGTIVCALEKSGFHHLTLETVDATGHAVKTTVGIHAHGPDEHAWEGQQGVRIDLLPDKKQYQPGDTAHLLIKTPISGQALVTVERGDVERAFLTRLDGENPVIDVPLTDIDSPNVHVGVMIVEGTDKSHLKHPVPRARFGYAHLAVTRRLQSLQVSVDPAEPSIRPGSPATARVTVTDHHGNPISGAAVVFYAVDEGTLAVAGYQSPSPLKVFHPDRRLRVRTGATLDDIVPEDPEDLQIWNKGYTIGGGGAPAPPAARSNFTPTACWLTLVTDMRGQADAVFKVPDTLTRYRLVAVAAAPDFWRFGTGEGALEVNKLLMVSPQPPRFAHAGDLIEARATVFNRSERTGTFRVSLDPGSTCTLESTSRLELDLAPGESQPVSFQVRFREPGEMLWRWEAKPVRLNPEASPAEMTDMSDAVESTFQVRHPIPLLRERFARSITPGSAPLPLFDGADPLLLQGDGELVLTISNNRLVDGLGAVDQLLTYPYGCAEQTSSALLPWLAADTLRPLIPHAPDEEAVRQTVSMGIAKLATMQTSSGGLAYWPDGDTPTLWASAHAAEILLLAKKGGFSVPEEFFDELLDYLAEELHGYAEEKDPYALTDRLRALYVLASAGMADAATLNRLYEDRTRLSTDAQLYLVLALAAADKTNERAIRTLVGIDPNEEKPLTWWYPDTQRLALHIRAALAAKTTRDTVDALVDELFKRRNAEGHWGNTYCNAWALRALADYHTAYQTNTPTPARATVTWGEHKKQVSLDARPMSTQIRIPLANLPGSTVPTITLDEGNGALFIDTELRARPREMPAKRASHAFRIDRRYQKVLSDGTLATVGSTLRMGDLVAVTLDFAVTGRPRYLAIDDPLPASLEAVNPEFESQGGSNAAMAQARTWAADRVELRDDRAVFFCNALSRSGEFTVTYLARVTAAGDVFAPPPVIKAMYDPALTAIGEGRTLHTKTTKSGK